ncbi:MAG: aminodeoxychorismate/anthranilate synthase component II [Acidobacteria bacterium]|nr:MAG: aminodeoxychorismate/anthranilate synthase component II [Acidobacteriota bacterium]
MPRVVLIDNYDSFTWNLVQAFAVLGAEVVVRRNDVVTVDHVEALEPTHLVISPGPGRPEHAGISMAAIERFLGRVPVLGVCLGHQALAAVLGGRIVHAQALMHGKSSPVYHDGRGLFEGLANPFEAGRYHSLAVAEQDLPQELAVSAYTSDGEIMGVRHRTLPAAGVQFHPESVLTPEGDRLLRNFLDFAPDRDAEAVR